MKSILKYLVLALLVLAASFAGSLALRNVFAFTEPSAPPPSGNVPIPINVSSAAQTKTGALTIQSDLSARRFCSVDSPTLCVDLTGTTTLAGNIDLGGVGSVVNYTAGYVPAQPGDLATKAYVDSKIPQPSTSGNKWVFVSSKGFQGNMNKTISDTLSGIPLGNQRCGEMASGAGLNGTYKVWLSTQTTAAKDNIFCSDTKAYFRTDGLAVASNCTDLLDGTIANPINTTERGVAPADAQTAVWTNTNMNPVNGPTGQYYAGYGNSYTCNNWTSNDPALTGIYGLRTYINYSWSWYSSTGCDNNTMHLYCFQI